MNPFKYGCIVNGDYFCPRIKLERELQQYALDGQNVVIQGERRIGKTSLVKHAISNLKGMRLLYIDLYAIRDLAGLCHCVANGIGLMTENFGFLKKAISFISNLRPTITLDPQTGVPTLSVDARAANEPQSLQIVLNAIENIAKGGKVCVVFDEFQDILKVRNGDQILAEMRSRIQFQADIPYFFMGSIRNDMLQIFSSPDSPFFKSAMPFEVGPIDETDFSAFIIRRFKVGKRCIDKATARSIIHFAAGVSGDIQELCKALWESSGENAVIGEQDIPRALEAIFQHELRGYEAAIERLTPIQLSTLRTLARTGNSEICGNRFMEDARLTNPSVVRRATTKLISERIVYRYKGAYHFSNPFFREWIVRHI